MSRAASREQGGGPAERGRCFRRSSRATVRKPETRACRAGPGKPPAALRRPFRPCRGSNRDREGAVGVREASVGATRRVGRPFQATPRRGAPVPQVGRFPVEDGQCPLEGAGQALESGGRARGLRGAGEWTGIAPRSRLLVPHREPSRPDQRGGGHGKGRGATRGDEAGGLRLHDRGGRRPQRDRPRARRASQGAPPRSAAGGVGLRLRSPRRGGRAGPEASPLGARGRGAGRSAEGRRSRRRSPKTPRERETLPPPARKEGMGGGCCGGRVGHLGSYAPGVRR